MTKRKKPEDKLKLGAPCFPYTQEMSTAICRAVSTAPYGLERICRDNPTFPRAATIYCWRLDYPDFAEKYAEAKRIQADILAENIMDISDDTSNDYIVDDEGKERLNGEHIQRSRLRVDSRKWMASKLLPKIYGDKVQNEVIATVRHEDALKELE